MRKGILLAGGAGTRLHPVTKVVNKHLLPVYNKPMIYYPLSVLMLAGIRNILIISNPEHICQFMNLFHDGSHLGLNIEYAVQKEPKGIAQAFTIGEQFIGADPVALILGDNTFYGHGFQDKLIETSRDNQEGATIFIHSVDDPKRFGVAEYKNGMVVSLEEKPENPKSNYAVTGLYFYDNLVIDIAKELKPSARGELEITDVNRSYMRSYTLRAEILGRGFAWLDTGTHDALLQSSSFMAAIERRQGFRVACIEEIAYVKGFIDIGQFTILALESKDQYLMDRVKEAKACR